MLINIRTAATIQIWMSSSSFLFPVKGLLLRCLTVSFLTIRADKAIHNTPNKMTMISRILTSKGIIFSYEKTIIPNRNDRL